MRPIDYRPSTGPNKYDASKSNQANNIPVDWSNYPNQYRVPSLSGGSLQNPASISIGSPANSRRVRGAGLLPGSSTSLANLNTVGSSATGQFQLLNSNAETQTP